MDVTVCDVGARDGLQNESVVLAPEVRVALIKRLASAGVPRIEAASFVNPARVPAMAGAEEIFDALSETASPMYTALILNERGFDRAIQAGALSLRYGLSATDDFGMRNQGQTTNDGLKIARGMVVRARREGRMIGVTVMVSFGCPFSGEVSTGRVIRIVEELMNDPPDEIQIADTIGVGVPNKVRELVEEMVRLGAPTGAHFHNTRGAGIANALTAFEAGATALDASIGGIGGCPFAPGATGNISTEDLVFILERMGVRTGIDLEALLEVSRWLGALLGKELPSMVARAGPFVPGR
jgi:isopropylmalate/homocitrate/citramalate synthase